MAKLVSKVYGDALFEAATTLPPSYVDELSPAHPCMADTP